MNFTGKILLIDDEPHIRKYVGLLLRQLGSPTVIEASNGAEGIATYQRESPDLVLLDVNMPGMDGIETLAGLKKIDPSCLVVMLTSLANRQTVENAQALEAAGYLRKDTPKEEIVRSLGEIIASCFSPEDLQP